jgi:TolB-like protein/Tfp pilus assembly protein PilF
MLATAGWWLHARWASAGVRSLAVLPFVDVSPQKEPDWFCDGITDEVIDALARVPGLHVAARASAFAFKGQARDFPKIGEQLGVGAVVEGSVRNAGGKLRITVRMNRTADGFQLWSETLERPAQDAFRVQQDIANAIAERIQIAGAAVRQPPHKPPQPAYNAYLEGRYFFHRQEPDSLNQALQRLDEATRIDPEFAPAWAWLSMARESLVDAGLVRPNQAMPAARDAAERAVVLDPNLCESHAALGIVKLQYDWDWAGARQEFDRAIQLSPGSAVVLHWSAHWYETQGRLDQAAAGMQRALALDPLSGTILGDLAGEYLAAGGPERALPLTQKAVDLHPKMPWVRLSLLDSLYASGQKDRARQMARELRDSPAAIPEYGLRYAEFSAKEGEPDQARGLLDRADDLRSEKYVAADVFTGLAAATKDWDSLFHWLEVEYEERSPHLPYARLSRDIPGSDPRFAALLERMNLPAPVK